MQIDFNDLIPSTTGSTITKPARATVPLAHGSLDGVVLLALPDCGQAEADVVAQNCLQRCKVVCKGKTYER
jgi:hypothetical protein